MVKYGSILVTNGGINADGGINIGNINPDGIRFIMEIEEIENKAIITQKLIAYLRTVLEIQFKEIVDGRKNGKNKS